MTNQSIQHHSSSTPSVPRIISWLLSSLWIATLLSPQALAFAPRLGNAASRISLLDFSRGLGLRQPFYQQSSRRQQQPTALAATFGNEEQRLLEIPLINLDQDHMVQALPSAHLPLELTTLNVYGMELHLPIHQTIVQSAMETQQGQPVLLGQVPSPPSSSSSEELKDDDSDKWVGAVGCVTQILLPPAAFMEQQAKSTGATDDRSTQQLLCRGMDRFIVRKVKQSVPFVVAQVEILNDERMEEDDNDSKDDDDKKSVSTTNESETTNDDDEEEDDDDDDDLYDDYASLTATELEGRLVSAIKEHVDQQLTMTEKEMSPLEQSLVEDFGHNAGLNAQHLAAEEEAAVFFALQQYLIDEFFYEPQQRYFALAFLAAEMASMGNDIRRKILQMTDTVERLRFVTAEMEERVAMSRARKMANAITDRQDESERDLTVGQPVLPPWAKSIRKGMVVEYFWNEEYEWCEGTVVEEPMQIADELIVTLHFTDDDSTHQLPFSPDEKARWRPASSEQGWQ